MSELLVADAVVVLWSQAAARSEFLAAEERLVAHLAPGERDELARLLRALNAGL